MNRKYVIAKEFSAGFAASLTPQARSPSESDHWLAGWDAGYAFRSEKNKLLNEYLVRAGEQPLLVIRPVGNKDYVEETG